jgi:hypothetical protein
MTKIKMTTLDPGRWDIRTTGYVTGPCTVNVYVTQALSVEVKVGDRSLVKGHIIGGDSETFRYERHEPGKMHAVHVIFDVPMLAEVGVVVKDHDRNVIGTSEHQKPERVG